MGLAAGETKTVTLTLPASRLAWWNADRHAFVRLECAIEVGETGGR